MVANFAAECAIFTMELSFVMNKKALKPLTWSMLSRNFLLISLSLPFLGCHFSSEDILLVSVRRARSRSSISVSPEYAPLDAGWEISVVVIAGVRWSPVVLWWSFLCVHGDGACLGVLVS